MADIARIALELDSAPLARGVQNARRLLEELSGAGERAGKGVASAGKTAAKTGEELDKSAASALRHAQALAALQRATGDYTGAVKTLSDQLTKLDKSSTSAVRIQTQIANIQNQAKRVGEGATFSGFLAGFQKIEAQLGTLGSKFAAFGNLPGLGLLGRLGQQADAAAVSLKSLGAAGSATGASLATAGLAIGGVIAGIGVITTAAVAGTKALFDFALAGSNAADNLNDIALITGISAEKLQVIKAAAIQSGASIEDFTRSAAVFGSKMGEISSSTVKSAQFLKAFGIDAKQAFLEPEKSVLEFGKRLIEIENASLRTAVAKEYLGRAGLKLIPTFQTLNAEGEKFGKTMEDTGQVLSGPVLDAAGKLSDKVAGLGSQFENFSIRIAAKTGPTFEKAIERMGDSMNSLEPIAIRVADKIASAFGETAREVQTIILLWETGLRLLTGSQIGGPRGAGTTAVSHGTDPALDRALARNRGFATDDRAIQELLNPQKVTKTGAAKAAKVPELSDLAQFRLDELGAQAELAGKDLAELRKALAESQANSYKLSQALEIFAATGQTKTREFAKAQDDLTKETARLAAIMAQIKLPAVSLGTAGLFGAIPGPLPVGGPASRADLFRSIPATEIPGIGGVTQSMERAAKALEIVAEQRGGLRQEFFGRRGVDQGGFATREEGVSDFLIKDFIRGIASGREGVREAAANTVQSFADFLADFSARKINDILQKQLESTFDSLFDFLGNVLGKLFNKIKAKFFDPLGDFIGGLFSSFGGFRAGGGDIGPGRFYVVGEKGPELFASKSAGTIYPNGAVMAGSGGGGPVNVTVNFSGVQNIQDFRRNENEIRRQLAAGVEQGNRMRGAR